MIKDLRDRVEPIIKEVGKLQLSYFPNARSLARHEKKGSGFVTEVDIKSEELLIERLSQILPEADFFAEESGISGNGDYRWIIDPLDGTINFAHGLPHFCISVALTYKNEPLFGMVYQPLLNELFWAEKGKGAWLNGSQIRVSLPKSFDESLLVVGLPYDAQRDYRPYLKQIRAVAPWVYTCRYLGAAALDLSYVACGRFDGIFFAGLAWWDFSAGDLLIREAGGRSSDFKGKPVGLDSKSYTAGGPLVHQRLLELLPG